MARNIFDTIVSVGGFSGEYEALTEVEISAAPGAPYTPPEEFDNFRVVSSRTVQMLGGSPLFFETFQTSACTIRLPCGAITTNDATNGRLYFFKNSGIDIVTIETCGVGTLPNEVIKQLLPTKETLIIHSNNDNWVSIALGESGITYRYSIRNRIPIGGTRYMETRTGIPTSSAGDRLTNNFSLIGFSFQLDVVETSNTYSLQILQNPDGTPIILAAGTIAPNTIGNIFKVNPPINLSEGDVIGARIVRTAGTGSSDFRRVNVSVKLE